MDDENFLLFEDLLRAAEARMREKIGEECALSVHKHLNDTLLKKLEAIDHLKFSENLWYNESDFVLKTQQNNFICFILSVSGEPSAFLYGYDYAESNSSFFLDEVATIIEGKGIGKVLITLLLRYCYEHGYKSVTLFTEDTDEKGRKLRIFYENIGFKEVTSDSDLGLVLRNDLNELKLIDLYNRVIFADGVAAQPTHQVYA